jgi:YegS/Rv2252/BmrU family lipid kinase
MSSPFGPLVLIANPKAGRGKVGPALLQVERSLKSQGLDYRVVVTGGPNHATLAARDAVEAGERFVVAMGGDGTIHEVVNGMVNDDGSIPPDQVLGVIAAGSGSDFVRTFGLPGDAEWAAGHLAGDATVPLDLGKVTYSTGGAQASRFFPNVAEAGLGGSVVARAANLPRWLGPSQYFLAFWMALPRFRATTIRLQADDRTFEGRVHNVVVANCRYFGGGMHISPKSDASDGMLDVLVMTGPKSDAFTLLPKVYRGSHLPHPNIVALRARRLHLESERPLQVEADGELLGLTPASFEAISRPLLLKI